MKLNIIIRARSAIKGFALAAAAGAALLAGSAEATTYANWTFNDGSGADSSGNGHNLGGNGPVISSPAGWGPSANCTSHGPGARAGFENWPDTSGWGLPTDNFTVGFWAKADAQAASNDSQSSMFDTQGGTPLWIGTRKDAGVWNWVINIGGTNLATFPTTPTAAQHIEVTREAGVYSVWLDDVKVAGPISASGPSWASLHVGVSSGGGSGYSGLFGDITVTSPAPHGLQISLDSPFNNQEFITGTSVTVSATVLSGTGPYTVEFFVDDVSAGTATTSDPYTLNLGALANGSYAIKAIVTDSSPAADTSDVHTILVAPASATTTVLATSGTPSTYGQSVTLTATVSPTPSGGQVQFYDDANPIGSPVTLTAGVAEYTTSAFAVAAHSITAQYIGYGVSQASTALALSQTVDQAQLTVTANNKMRAPGAPNPALTYTITGYQNGENAGSAGITGAPVLSTLAGNLSSVGSYPITCATGNLTAANYSFTLADGSLAVVDGAPPVSDGMVVWFDAANGVTANGGGVVSQWNDLSGNSHHATGGSPTLATSEVNGKPAVQFRGNYLNCAGTFFTKEQYVVVRSPHPSSWVGYGAFLGRADGRGSSYLLTPENTTMWNDQAAQSVSRNGVPLVKHQHSNGNYIYNLAPIDEYMLLKIVVNENDTSQASYQIARADGMSCDMDIAEIIGFDHALTSAEENQIGAFLAAKYSLTTTYPGPASILTFSILGSSCVINDVAKTIALAVPVGTDLATLAPTFTLTSGTCNQTSGSPPSPTFAVNNPTTYTVTDGAIINDYIVTVTVLQAAPGGVSSGLAVWLKADDVNSSDSTQVRTSGSDIFVQQWNDQSGNFNNASNSTDADQPMLIASALNGKPVLRFAQRDDNNGSRLKLGDLSAQFPSAATIFIVGTLNNDLQYSMFGNTSNDERWVGGNYSEVTPGAFRSGRADFNSQYSKMPHSGSHIFAYDSSSSAYNFALDGTQIGTTSGNYSSGSGRSWQIGSNACNNGAQLNGDIAEVIIFNRVLSTEEASLVGTYLTDKFDLNTAYATAKILTFGVPGISGVIDGGAISLTLPPGSDLSTFSPTFTLSSGTCNQTSGSPPSPTFAVNNPTTYTVTDGAIINDYIVTVTVATAPPNDAFANAIALSGNSGNRTGTGSQYCTTESGEPNINGANGTVWFKWTAPSSGNYTYGTVGSTSVSGGEWDSMISIHSGSSVNGLTTVGGPQDTGGEEAMTVAVTGGTTYYIQLAGYENQKASAIKLTWSFVSSGGPSGTFDTWASAQSPQVTGGASGDSDNDSIPNLVEYALNLDPAASDGAPGTLTGRVLSFAKRADAVANGDVTYEIETSPDLNNPWTTVIPDSNDGTTINYTLPAGEGAIFGRLKVTVP